jgi:hypothetical protein
MILIHRVLHSIRMFLRIVSSSVVLSSSNLLRICIKIDILHSNQRYTLELRMVINTF